MVHANTQALTIANAGTATLRDSMVSAATNTLGTDCATFDGTTVVGPTTPTERSSAAAPWAHRPEIAS